MWVEHTSSSARLLILSTLAMAMAITFPVSAQTMSQLKQENARLKAQINAMQNQRAGDGSASSTQGAIWNRNDLSARVTSIRVGQASGFVNGTIAVTVSIQLTNTGSSPIILNYKDGSLAVTDNQGTQYTLYHQGGAGDPSEDVKGIAVASGLGADSSSILSASSSRNVTFIATKYMKNGQRPGNAFDINATFVQLQDNGQGRLRVARDFPVSFTNVPGSTGGFLTDGSGTSGSSIKQMTENVLRALIK